MKHMHTPFPFIQDLGFRKLLTTSAIKTDVNPSDIGTKALGRDRFSRGLCLDWAMILLKHVHQEVGSMRIARRTYAELTEK